MDKDQNIQNPQIDRQVQLFRQELTRRYRLEYHPNLNNLHNILIDRNHPMPISLVDNKKRTDNISAIV